MWDVNEHQSLIAGTGVQDNDNQSVILAGNSATIEYGISNVLMFGANARMLRGYSLGGEQGGYGEYGISENFRAWYYGYRAWALEVSSAAIGPHTVSNAVHGLALARGAINEKRNSVQLGTQYLYFNQHANAGYYFEFDGVPHVDCNKGPVWRDPRAANSTGWIIGMSGKDFESGVYEGVDGGGHTSTQGGDLAFAGGPGTGTAVGGDVTYWGSSAGETDNNTENALVKRVTFYAEGDEHLHTPGAGLRLTSDDGTVFRLTVSNAGQLVLTQL